MASSAARRRLRTPPRATRTKPAFSYAEPDSDSDIEVFNGDSASEKENHIPARRSRRNAITPRATKRPHRASPRFYESDHSDHKPSPKKRKLSKMSPLKASASKSIVQVENSGVTLPWQSLPYHVLVQIFRYASYPLYDDHTFQPLPSSRWLLHAAHVCKAFAEPAFTVLYSSPPLVPMVQAHRLVDLLTADPLPMAFKYRQKVESLRIDVDQVVAYSLRGSGHLDLHGLIKDLPRLAALEFYHQKDRPPYRNLDDTIKWTYPESIFEALDYIDPKADGERGDKTSVCKLKSWRWSSRLAGKKWPIEMLPEVHLKPSFASLRKISFVNYQIPYLKKGEGDLKHENILADALKALPELEHVIFESSTLVNSKLLPLLPSSLRNLELINCWEVVADDFASFLLTHGSQLRCLTLNHNQSLSLSFLPTLGEACPKLQIFRMNFKYFNLHATYHDSEPQYDQLLLPEQVPVWPPTLQTIELIQLRKWETPAAEMFFQSLLDSASILPDLRRLTIQAILNIGWRDRASFRDKWVGSLARVFKRVSEDPESHISVQRLISASQSSLPTQKKEQPEVETAYAETKRKSPRSSTGSSSTASNVLPQEKQAGLPPARRSTRIREPQPGKYAETSDDSDDEPPVSAISAREASRRARLERELGILKTTAGIHTLDLASPSMTSDDSSNSDKALAQKGKGKEKEVIQGMCDVVEVRIDNLRPTETQVTEADFLDEERSGDSDWNGDHDNVESGYAW